MQIEKEIDFKGVLENIFALSKNIRIAQKYNLRWRNEGSLDFEENIEFRHRMSLLRISSTTL